MADPVLTIRPHDDPTSEWAGALAYDDGDGGAVERGADSELVQFRVYNDYGGTVGSVDAINVRLTSVDADTGNGFAQQAEEPVQEHWLHVRLISDNGVDVSGTDQVVGSIEGTIADDGLNNAIYHKEAGHQTVVSNAYLAFATFVRVPADAGTGSHTFAIRVEYDFV